MTQAECRTYLQAATPQWVARLGLGSVRVQVGFDERKHFASFVINTQSREHRHIRLEFNLKDLSRKRWIDEHELDYFICHELLHAKYPRAGETDIVELARLIVELYHTRPYAECCTCSHK